ncbi:tripartite tricarboxylate transporter permease [Bengtsoniella intestinalis]|uniref:tripartite tricarboxylate transporter permease n=1 Tax=Bengtsoniella intestinalis TaxID=3073143 RepID=UPI00391F8E44
MMSLQELLIYFLDPTLLGLMALGVLMGLVFGCIPGLNTAMALALALPLTYDMEMFVAISFLLAVYCGGLSGGSISAILLNIPGTAASVTTTFDGYPMAQRGESMRALSLATISSLVGGLISAIILAFLTSSLANFALGFGPWEYFGAALFSLALISTLLDGSILKGMMATCFGVLLAMIGTDPIVSQSRFTFGFYELSAGLDIVIVIIGVFALSEIIYSTNKSLTMQKSVDSDFSIRGFIRSFGEVRHHMFNMISSSVLGTVIGILPGLGGSTAGMVTYSRAKVASKNPEKFGTGCPEGIIGPEAAKNAVSGGAMIPAIALGVPGSSPVALIMSAFLVHGVTIGPLIISERPDILQAVFIALIIANVFMFVIQAGLIRWFASIISVSKYILFPVIAVFCVVGAYLVNTSIFHVVVMLILAVVGMVLIKNGFQAAPIVMGFTLGGTVESYYRKAMITYQGSFVDAITTPSLGTVFVLLAIIIPVVIMVRRSYKYLKAQKVSA